MRNPKPKRPRVRAYDPVVEEIARATHLPPEELQRYLTRFKNETTRLGGASVEQWFSNDKRRNNVPPQNILFALAILNVRVRAGVALIDDAVPLANWLETKSRPRHDTRHFRDLVVQALQKLLEELHTKFYKP